MHALTVDKKLQRAVALMNANQRVIQEAHRAITMVDPRVVDAMFALQETLAPRPRPAPVRRSAPTPRSERPPRIDPMPVFLEEHFGEFI